MVKEKESVYAYVSWYKPVLRCPDTPSQLQVSENIGTDSQLDPKIYHCPHPVLRYPDQDHFPWGSRSRPTTVYMEALQALSQITIKEGLYADWPR